MKSSAAFKTVATKNITRHTAHKSYAISIVGSSGSFDGLEVFSYTGKENTGEYGLADTATTNGYNKRDIYSSINTDFYMKVPFALSGSNGEARGLLDQTHSGSLRTLIDPLSTSRVISIPHLMIGDGIKPGSVKIATTSPYTKTYIDDSNGNLISESHHSKAGNVFYTHGIIVLHSGPDNYFETCNLTFKNTHVIEEHEYMCNASKNEFNASTNHSVISSSGVMHGFVSSSAWNPYVTTVGLYDDDNNLLVVGKLGQPIKKSEKYDTSYVIRFDT